MGKDIEKMEMDSRFIKNAFMVIVSNVCVLVSGIAVGIYLPKIMTPLEYGNYKVFTLYSTYAGLLHFGFVNGIYLKYGGWKYSDLPKEKTRFYFRYFIVQQFGAGCIAFVLLYLLNAYIVKDAVSQVIIVFIVLEVGVQNLISFFQFISQAVQRFKQLSVINTLKSFSLIILVAILYIVLKSHTNISISSERYIFLYIVINICVLCCYFFLYRDIFWGKMKIDKSDKKEIIFFHKTGIPLLLAGIIVNLLLVLDRQFVSIFFSKEVYGVYSFAYSMLNLVSVLITSVAVLMYPTLKQLKREEVIKKYTTNVMYISIVVAICLCIYFPLEKFITWFLPSYIDSIEVFRVILPGLGLSCSISVVLSNYYKVLDEIKMYTKICFTILIIAIISNFLAYTIQGTTIAISKASIVTIIIWYVYAEVYLAKKYSLGTKHNFLFNMFTLCVFYASTSIKNNVIGICTYLICICFAISVRIFYEKKIGNIKDEGANC